MARSLSFTNLGLTQPATLEPLLVSLGLKDIDVLDWKGDLIAIGVTEMDMGKDKDMKFENTILNKLDLKLGGLLAEASSEEGLTGKPRQSSILRLTGFGSKRIGLIGLGHQSPSVATYRGFGETVAAAAKTAQASNVAVVLAAPPQNMLTTVSAIASGTILGTHEDLRFKSESKKLSLKSLDIIGFGTGPELEKRLKYVEYMCSGTIFGRELVDAPANVLTPGEQFRLSFPLPGDKK